MDSGDKLSELAGEIAKDTALLDSRSFKTPSQEAAARARILTATRDLHHRVLGPRSSLRSLLAHNDTFVLQAIDRFDIVRFVPREGSISFDDLSSMTGVRLSELRRIVRYAITSHVFCEPQPGFVAHTEASMLLVDDPIFRGSMSMTTNETASGAAHTIESMQKYPASEEPHLSGWGLANSAKEPMFEELQKNHPARAKVVGQTMDFYSSHVPIQPLIDNFPWDSLGESVVVDIGGCHGPVSIALAQSFFNLRFVIQDLAGPVQDGRNRLPTHLRDRVSFMEHDFFTEQPIKNADVYFFRAVMHNWPDKYCVKMLQALRPALKNGARVVINDTCLPEPYTLDAWTNREIRNVDLNMFHLFNSRDREQDEWNRLFAEADPRFRFQGAKSPVINRTNTPTSALMSIIEAVWEL